MSAIVVISALRVNFLDSQEKKSAIHFLQKADILHEMPNSVVWKKVRKQYFKMVSAEMLTEYAIKC